MFSFGKASGLHIRKSGFWESGLAFLSFILFNCKIESIPLPIPKGGWKEQMRYVTGFILIFGKTNTIM